jgi:ABC-2 type transport system permease protein
MFLWKAWGDQMTEAHIFSQGFRSYGGPRTGLIGAAKSLVKQSLRQTMGLGKGASHKVLPFGIVLGSYLPAIVFVGMAVFARTLGEGFGELITEAIPTYAAFYGYINFLVVVMAAFIVPELLCSDRRTGMLGVYLASPLDRVTYLVSKGAAALEMILFVCFGPPLLLLVGRTLLNLGPDGFVDWIETFGKILLSSTVVGLFYVTIALALSSVTDRKAFASIALIVAIFGAFAVTQIMVEGMELSNNFKLLDLLEIPGQLYRRIFEESITGGNWAPVATSNIWLSWLGIVVLALTVVWLSYRRLLVRR